MIPADVLQRKIDELPEPVLNYLYSEQAGERNLQIIERHGLNEAQEEIFFTLLRELFVKALPLERLTLEVRERFGFDGVKTKALAVDIAGYRLLPLDKWLGDVSAYLRANGADPKDFPEMRVMVAHRTADEVAEEVATTVAPDTDPRLRNRLGKIVESFLAGVRTESQTFEALTRPEKVGGAGLDESSAAHVLEEVREETRTVVIDHADPTEKEKNPGESLPAAARKKETEGLVLTTEEALEVAEFKPSSAAKEVDAAAEEIYRASGLSFQDPVIEKKTKTVIASRLRDVRDQMEALEIMTQPKELGGLGLGQDAARALLNAIQARLRAQETASRTKVQSEKTHWMEKERVQKARAETQQNVAQKVQMERLYKSVVTGPKNAAPAPAAAASPAPVMGKSAAPDNLPIASAIPVPPAFRAEAPPVSPSAPALERAPTPHPAATIVKPLPASPAAPVPTGSFAQRPKLEDVKVSPKLTGPVEELRALSIVDFRRLSKDPKEACANVKGKIDLLAEQSYSRRNEAIAAWMSSEVVRTYLELMRESLNGTPLVEAIAARQSAKSPVLTPEEFRAVSELSRHLRY